MVCGCGEEGEWDSGCGGEAMNRRNGYIYCWVMDDWIKRFGCPELSNKSGIMKGHIIKSLCNRICDRCFVNRMHSSGAVSDSAVNEYESIIGGGN